MELLCFHCKISVATVCQLLSAHPLLTNIILETQSILPEMTEIKNLKGCKIQDHEVICSIVMVETRVQLFELTMLLVKGKLYFQMHLYHLQNHGPFLQRKMRSLNFAEQKLHTFFQQNIGSLDFTCSRRLLK